MEETAESEEGGASLSPEYCRNIVIRGRLFWIFCITGTSRIRPPTDAGSFIVPELWFEFAAIYNSGSTLPISCTSDSPGGGGGGAVSATGTPYVTDGVPLKAEMIRLLTQK